MFFIYHSLEVNCLSIFYSSLLAFRFFRSLSLSHSLSVFLSHSLSLSLTLTLTHFPSHFITPNYLTYSVNGNLILQIDFQYFIVFPSSTFALFINPNILPNLSTISHFFFLILSYSFPSLTVLFSSLLSFRFISALHDLSGGVDLDEYSLETSKDEVSKSVSICK